MSLDLEWCFYFTKNKGTATLNERRVAVVQVTDVCGMVLIIQIFGMRRMSNFLRGISDISHYQFRISQKSPGLFYTYHLIGKV